MAPQQPMALPPSYIMDFVRNVFTEDLCLVDFTQALTAMNYLKDLEVRRKDEMNAVLRRLSIDADTLDAEKERLRRDQPQVADWVAGIVDKAKRVESLYTQVYIGLRRWTLINEMRLEPFNKPNCLAMLNMLYPTNYTTLPSSGLTSSHLNSQRNAFFRYIISVETNGKNVLQKLEQQGKRPQDVNAWPIVRVIVEKYLRTSSSLITDCTTVKTTADAEVQSQRMEKRTDSGISLGSNKSAGSGDSSFKNAITYDTFRPSTTQSSYLDIPRSRSGSATSYHRRSGSKDDPIPIVRPEQLRQKEVRKVGSTLERLARELKRMRSRSNDRAADLDHHDRPTSRSRGSSDSAGEADDVHQFSISHAPIPLPPSTATTANFPDAIRDDDQIMPLPPTTSRTKSLKKIKSASNLSARDSSFSTYSKYGQIPQTPKFSAMPQPPRTPAFSIASGIMTLPGSGATDRKFSIPSLPRGTHNFNITEEERTRMIVRAKAEKASALERERHSPIRSRSDTIQSGESNGSTGSESGKMSLEPTIAPIRKMSPGRNKLRDYFGVDTLQVPTTFAN